MVNTTKIKYGCFNSTSLVSCNSATSSRGVLVHPAMWCLGLGFILEGRTGEYMVKGKPCGFWAGCGQHCPVNLISSVPMFRYVCLVSCIRGQCGWRVTPQSVVPLCHYNDHYNGADLNLGLVVANVCIIFNPTVTHVVMDVATWCKHKSFFCWHAQTNLTRGIFSPIMMIVCCIRISSHQPGGHHSYIYTSCKLPSPIYKSVF